MISARRDRTSIVKAVRFPESSLNEIVRYLKDREQILKTELREQREIDKKLPALTRLAEVENTLLWIVTNIDGCELEG